MIPTRTFVLRSPEIVARCLAHIGSLPPPVGNRRPWRVVVELDEAAYSDEQCNTFWMWCGECAAQFRDAGIACSKERVHDAVLAEIFGVRPNPINPLVMEPAQTLTKPRRLTKLEKCEVLTRFQVWAAENNIELTQPDPVATRGDE